MTDQTLENWRKQKTEETLDEPSKSPFDVFRENTPLNDIPKDSVDEFLDRINEDIVSGAPERITDERIAQLAEIYRRDAIEWEIKQKEKPERKTKKSKPEPVLDLEITL